MIEISISEIVSDPGAQARVQLDQTVVLDYLDALIDGATLPPIRVVAGAGAYHLADGWHRVEAHRRARRETIQAEVLSPLPEAGGDPRRTAILLAAGANTAHGLRRSRADVARACGLLLADPEWARWSDREIARRVGCHHQTVSARRAELAASGENRQIEPAPRTVRRGDQVYQQAARQPAPPPEEERISTIRRCESIAALETAGHAPLSRALQAEIEIQAALLALADRLDLPGLESLQVGHLPDHPAAYDLTVAETRALLAGPEVRPGVWSAVGRRIPGLRAPPPPADFSGAKQAAAEKLATARAAAPTHLAHARNLIDRDESEILLALPAIPDAVLAYALDLERERTPERPGVVEALSARIDALRHGPRWAVEILIGEEDGALERLRDLEADGEEDLEALLSLEHYLYGETRPVLVAELERILDEMLEGGAPEVESAAPAPISGADPEILALQAARLIRLCDPATAREILDWIQDRIGGAA